MPEDLTAAEQAAAEALAERHNAHSDTEHLAVAAFAGEARAVVEAVRPILAAEALREVAAELRLKTPEPGTLFFVDAEGLERRAEDRLAAARQSGEGQH